MEVGKYISLGHSIQVRLAKDGQYTYFYNYRDENDRDAKGKAKVKRKKLFTASEATPKNLKKAILLSDNVFELEEETKKADEKYTLLYLKRFYFDKKLEDKHNELKTLYNNLSPERLVENTNYKNKMQNVRKEERRFDKAFLHHDIVKKDIREITPLEAESFIKTEVHSMTKKSLYAVMGLARAIINFAIKKRVIDCANPFASLDINFKGVHKNRLRYLTKDETAQLLLACREYKKDQNVFNAVYLAILTAARRATVLNIRKKDFDFTTGVLKLYNLKSDKYYSMKLNREALEYFKNYLKDFDYDEYVIRPNDPQRRKKQAMRDVPKRIYRIMDEMFNQGLDKKDNEDRDNVVNFHTLRRTVATNLALDNVSIYKIMRLLNHTTEKQTRDYLNLSNLNMTSEIESTHTNLYEYIDIEKQNVKEQMGISEYVAYLQSDNFFSSSDLSGFENEVSYWRFKLEDEFADGKTLDDFKTIADLKHYLEYRNEFSTLEEYEMSKLPEHYEATDEEFDELEKLSRA